MELSRIRVEVGLNVVLFLGLNVLDYWTTVACRSKGDWFVGGLANNGELTPIVAFLTPAAMLLYKILFPLVVLFVLYKLRHYKFKRCNMLNVLRLLNILLFCIVLWNVFWLAMV